MSKLVSIYGIGDRNKFRYPGFVHDHNYCFLQDDQLLTYCHLERETRVKYDNQFNLHAERLLLDDKSVEISPETIFLYVNSFVGSSFLSENGRIRFDCANTEKNLLKPVRGFGWIQNKDWEGFEVESWSVSHEIAHAFSVVPFAGRLHENSLLVSFDGGSSTGNFAAFHYKNGQLIQLESHWELSHLSKLFNDNGLSFGIVNASPGEHCSVPGKLMGYASWGKKDDKTLNWLKRHDFFRDSWNSREKFYHNAEKDFKWFGSLETNRDPFLFNLAACIQDHFREGILSKIGKLAEKTGADYLYYAGGCALNIVANAELVANGWFRDVFISPCCNDSGLSIGASAYWAFLHEREIKVTSPYLNNRKCTEVFSFSNEDTINTADALLSGEVLGVCNGAAEVGPRALGNRSILSLADSKKLANRVSMDIKEREWYRPVAPIMLEKNARMVTGFNEIHSLSRYMLLDFKILGEFINSIEGAVHANGTSRIQTIFTRQDNPFIFDLLDYLDREHNVKALINTSFNGKGEPIVQTPDDAVDSAMKMKLNGLVINGIFQEL